MFVWYFRDQVLKIRNEIFLRPEKHWIYEERAKCFTGMPQVLWTKTVSKYAKTLTEEE
jgi:hypothetical protein